MLGPDGEADYGEQLSKSVAIIKLFATINRVSLHEELSRVPEFGIWNPSVTAAAELMVTDMWFSGAIESVKEPDDFDGNARAPWLKAALADRINAFETRLSSAIESGKLKASAIRRDLNDRLIPEQTHINFDQMVDWMDERHLTPGEHFEDWRRHETVIRNRISSEVFFLRAVYKIGDKELSRIDNQSFQASMGLLDDAREIELLRRDLKKKISEFDRLINQLERPLSDKPPKVDRPLGTRQRRTLLTIIAALCDRAGIDHQARGAARRIKGAAELIGAPIDDETISKLLDEIPDALETRMK